MSLQDTMQDPLHWSAVQHSWPAPVSQSMSPSQAIPSGSSTTFPVELLELELLELESLLPSPVLELGPVVVSSVVVGSPVTEVDSFVVELPEAVATVGSELAVEPDAEPELLPPLLPSVMSSVAVKLVHPARRSATPREAPIRIRGS